jgi:hypothetical protein
MWGDRALPSRRQRLLHPADNTPTLIRHGRSLANSHISGNLRTPGRVITHIQDLSDIRIQNRKLAEKNQPLRQFSTNTGWKDSPIGLVSYEILTQITFRVTPHIHGWDGRNPHEILRFGWQNVLQPCHKQMGSIQVADGLYKPCDSLLVWLRLPADPSRNICRVHTPKGRQVRLASIPGAQPVAYPFGAPRHGWKIVIQTFSATVHLLLDAKLRYPQWCGCSNFADDATFLYCQ